MFLNITENGEIQFDTEQNLYFVFDETYTDPIFVTQSQKSAEEELRRYCEYLDGNGTRYIEQLVDTLITI